MNYLLHLLIYLDVYAIVALSLNMVLGYCGLLTLAHAGYFAIGSYVYALTSLEFGWGIIPAILISILVSGTLSLAVSLPSWRFKGDFFVLISLAVQAFLFTLFYNWQTPGAEIGTVANLTNGPFGIAGIPKPAIFSIKCDTIGSIAVLSTAVLAVCGVVAWLLLSSPWGRLLRAIRDDELATRGLGKNVRLAKLEVFFVSCSMAAVAGAIYCSYVGYIDPGSASLDHSILMLSMVIVGGVGNLWGPFVGALVLLAIPEALRFASVPESLAGNLRLLAYGVLLLLMVHFRPKGLAGRQRME
jgi:branched-chain amino acid transport system permease protein